MLGRRSPEVVGVKGLRGLAGTPGPGPEAFMRPRRALCRREPLGEAGPRLSVRRGRVLGPIANERNGVSPGAAWVPPIGSPPRRSACVPSLGASTRTCVDGVLFPPLRASV